MHSKDIKSKRIHRFYHSGVLAFGERVKLDKAVSHHIVKVLRLAVDDEVQLFNGNNMNYQAIITGCGKIAEVKIIAEHLANTESLLKIHLGQAISRNDKMDFTLQKAVELGVNAITPLISERVQFRLGDKRTERKMLHWNKVIESAAQQSGRASLPRLNPITPLTNWLTAETTMGLIFVPRAEKSLMDVEQQQSLRLLIGPEGGFTDDEIATALKTATFQASHLGPRILRTETAALTAISILQARFGDL